jgi:hypothetical protein
MYICAECPYIAPLPTDAESAGMIEDHQTIRAMTLDIRVIIAHFFGSICGEDHPYITRSAQNYLLVGMPPGNPGLPGG